MAASNQKHCKHFLKLSDKPLRFEPVNEVNQVFFDDTLGQVESFFKEKQSDY